MCADNRIRTRTQIHVCFPWWQGLVVQAKMVLSCLSRTGGRFSAALRNTAKSSLSVGPYKTHVLASQACAPAAPTVPCGPLASCSIYGVQPWCRVRPPLPNARFKASPIITIPPAFLLHVLYIDVSSTAPFPGPEKSSVVSTQIMATLLCTEIVKHVRHWATRLRLAEFGGKAPGLVNPMFAFSVLAIPISREYLRLLAGLAC